MYKDLGLTGLKRSVKASLKWDKEDDEDITLFIRDLAIQDDSDGTPTLISCKYYS